MVTWLPRIPRLERRHGTVGTRPRHRRSSFQIPARGSITSHIASINTISSSVPQFRHGCTIYISTQYLEKAPITVISYLPTLSWR